MKVKKVLVSVLCLLVACLSFAGCEWGNKKYSLELYVNDTTMGKVEVKPALTEYQKGTEITVTAVALNGFEFVSWLDFETKTVILTESGVPEGAAYTFDINKNTQLQAVFQKVVSFVFNTNGGTVKDSADSTATVKGIKLNDVIKLPVLEKVGYDFLGWKIGDNLITEATYTITSIPTNRADITATAQFREAKTVNFNLGGGKVVDTDATEINSIKDVKVDDEITLPTLAKTGYIFGGWIFNDRVNRPYIDKYVITESDLDEEGKTIDFTAKWTAKQYTLALNIKDEAVEGGWKNINTSGKVLTYDAEIGELISYNEDGTEAYFWYTDSEFNNAVDVTAKWQEDSDEPVKFYGRVEASKKYVIDVEGKQTTIVIAESDNTEYNIVKDILKVESLTKEGYDFKGFVLDGVEPENVVETLKYDANAAGTYKVKFEIKHYNVTFYKTDKFTFALEDGYNAINPAFGTEIKFKVTVSEGYKLDKVYYTISGSEDKVVLTADASGIYTFKVPASNIVINADTKVNYTINYFNGEEKQTVDAEKYVTSLLQDSTSLNGKIFYYLPNSNKNFGGWALTNGGSAVITASGLFTESFWQTVSESVSGTTLNLYAVWSDPTAYTSYIYSMAKAGYSIVPLKNSTYSEKFNKNVGFYNYLTYLSQTYGNMLDDIKNNTTSVTTNNQAQIMAYNLLTMFDLNGEEVLPKSSLAKYSNLIVMDRTNGNSIVEVSALITIYIRDASGELLATNRENAITLDTLKKLPGDLRIEFSFVQTNA